MKKVIATFLASAMTLSLAACAQTPAPVTSTQPPAPSAPSSASTSTAEDVKNPAYSMNGFETTDAEGNRLITGRDATGSHAMITTSKYEASQVGEEIMKQGGNAIDAAVAVAFALGVCEPQTSGLGGGGLMLLHTAKGENVFVDFREIAPGAATPDMYPRDENGKVLDDKMWLGGLAVGVPGEVAGLMYLLENYGSGNLTREQIMAPAIRIAEEGFLVSPYFDGVLKDKYDVLSQFPEAQKIYWDESGLPYEVGDVITNPDLAKTLRIIAEQGADGFYKGEVAEAIVASANKYGGILTMDDLANYTVTVRTPVSTDYRGYEVVSSPPPSSGGAHMIEILNILENFDIPAMEVNSAEYIHLFSEAHKLAYADRAQYMADTDFAEVPLSGITSKEYAKTLAEQIDLNQSGSFTFGDPWAFEHEDTTHFSIADDEGNMVGITKTVNYFFGSGVFVDGYGFPLNDEMDDFSSNPEHVNRVEAGKKPLSSMTPTIVLKDGAPFMVLGSPGSARIFGTVAQVLSRVIDSGMDIQDAVNAPRIWDDAAWGRDSGVIQYERAMVGIDPISEETLAQLEEMGHGTSDMGLGGCVQAIVYQPDGTLRGAADPRQDGKSVGY